MSGLVLLMGLLVLSFAGSMLVAARPGRSVGFASGTELVALGLALGPEAFGLIGPDALSTLAPMAHVALGWVGLILGVEAAAALRAARRDGTLGAFARGFAIALFTIVVVAPVAFAILHLVDRRPFDDAATLALAIGAACAGVLRAPPRDGDEAPGAADSRDTRASGADVAVLLALVATSLVRAPTSVQAPPIWAAASPLVGAALGAIAALLLGKAPRDDATWGVLLGVALLAIGIAARMSLHAIAITFAMGALLVLVSPARGHVRALLAPTERAVELPLLVLAGASIVLRPLGSTRVVVAVVVATIAGRHLARVPLARRASGEARATLFGASPLGAFVGLSYALVDPEPRCSLPLLAAAAVGVVAEIARARARALASTEDEPRALVGDDGGAS